MQVAIKASRIAGSPKIPPSKSHTMRAIIFAMLARGTSHIENMLISDDAKKLIDACITFGSCIDYSNPDRVYIRGTGGVLTTPDNVIDCGNSGIALRFLMAVSTLQPNTTVITGDTSIRSQRPVHDLISGLKQLGVDAWTTRGGHYAPVVIRGLSHPKRVQISGVDSQPVSALLILASMLNGTTLIEIEGAREKPWLDLTLNWLTKLNVYYTRNGYEEITVTGGGFNAFEYRVPADWSSAMYPIAAAIVTEGDLHLENVNYDDPQGDKIFLEILKSMGASIHYDQSRHAVTISGQQRLQGITADCDGCIDMVTLLAVLGCIASGETVITGAEGARQKECDRIACIVSELRTMGADIQETHDGLIVRQSCLIGTRVKSYGDHRMVFALSVAALIAEGETMIIDSQCIDKTFPKYFDEMQAAGMEVKICA